MLIDKLVRHQGPYKQLPYPLSSPDDIIPFGKYRGQHINEFIHDNSYINWLVQHPFLPTRYPEFFTRLSHYVKNSLCHPERNSVQALFTDKTVCQILFHSIFFNLYTKSKAQHKKNNDLTYQGFVVGTDRTYQSEGFDVIISGTVAEYWSSPDDSTDDVLKKSFSGFVRIKIIYELGDDYPMFIRILRRKYTDNAAVVLLYKKYIGRGASFNAVRTMFEESDIYILNYTQIKTLKAPEGVCILEV